MPQLYPESVQRLIAEFGRLPGIGARSAERLAFHILSSSREEAMGLAVAIRDVKQSIRACKRCFNTAEGELCPVCRSNGRDAELLCVVELPRDIIALEKCGGYNGLYHVLQGRLDPLSGIGPERLRISELFRRLHNGLEQPARSEAEAAEAEANLTDSTPAAAPAAAVDSSTAANAVDDGTEDQDTAVEAGSAPLGGHSEIEEVAAVLDAPAQEPSSPESVIAKGKAFAIREVILALNPTAEGDATASYLARELAAEFPGLCITRLARGLASGTDLESSAPSSLQYALSGRLSMD